MTSDKDMNGVASNVRLIELLTESAIKTLKTNTCSIFINVMTNIVRMLWCRKFGTMLPILFFGPSRDHRTMMRWSEWSLKR